MSDLESELRHAIKNGFLHLSLSKAWKGPNWDAGYRTTDSHNTHYASDPDPVAAIRKAMRHGVAESKRILKDAPKVEPKKPVTKKSRRDAEDLI